MSESAHQGVFGERWDKDIERVDFAMLMVLKPSDKVVSYATAQEVDADTVYLQYGGAFDAYRNQPVVFYSFVAMLEFLSSNYKKIVTLVENTNQTMLRFYMKAGFLITGIRYWGDHVFLENSYAAKC